MLEDFIAANKLSAKIMLMAQDTHTAAKAATQLGMDGENVAKSIVLLDSDGNTIIVVLLGKDKVDFEKVKEIMGVKDVALAEPEEVLAITGYEVGGVPPVSIYGVTTIVDSALLKKDEVICGGGTPMHLLRIKVQDILDHAENVIVENIRK